VSDVSAPSVGAPAEPQVTPRRFVAFAALVFGMFMAILDIQIVASSLGEIQAGLSAAPQEIAWVQTSYLVAEVIMIPLSGFLARGLSTRVLFAISAGGFTIASVLCATATSINEMIVYRAIQGFIGGGMIPTAFAAAYTIFPRRLMAPVMAVVGLTVTLAPTIGPTIGGYLTDVFSWHWLFLINVVPGTVATVLAWTLIDFDEPDYALLRRLDVLGLAALAIFLGCLEYVLEQGPVDDWFESRTIATLAVISAVGGVAFFWRAFTAKVPIVDLYAYVDRNFAVGSLLTFILGMGLYGLTYLYPLYLARVRGYNALQVGETMFVTGAAMFVAAPIVGTVARLVDQRYLIGAGFAGFVLSCVELMPITSQWGFWELLWPQVLRGVSLMFCMVPINVVSLGTLAPEHLKNAAGLFNTVRNLGGAFGLATINTILNYRTDLHILRLREQVVWGRQAADEALAGLTQRYLPLLGSDAELAATKTLSRLVFREALTLAFADVFLLIAVTFSVCAVLVLLVQRPRLDAAAEPAH
jgi:DHA2 family multidrug resistance protein